MNLIKIRKYFLAIAGIIMLVVIAVSLSMLQKKSVYNKNGVLYVADFMKKSGFPQLKGVSVPIGYTLNTGYVIDNGCVDCVVTSFKEDLEKDGWEISIRKMDEYLMAIIKNYKDSLSGGDNASVQGNLPPMINQKAAEYIANNDEETIRKGISSFAPTIIEGVRKRDGMKCMISVTATSEGKKAAVTIQVASN